MILRPATAEANTVVSKASRSRSSPSTSSCIGAEGSPPEGASITRVMNSPGPEPAPTSNVISHDITPPQRSSPDSSHSVNAQ